MAYRLTERPHKFSFSNNPVRYVFSITNPDTPGCALDVELYTIPIGDEELPAGELGTLITRQTLYPNPDGTVPFYCEDFLNSYLDWELPSLTNNDIVAVTGQIRKYYVRYRQTTKTNPSPAWATDAEHLRIVLKGGITKEKFDRNNFFVNHLPAQKPFLTWQPANHFIGTDERRYLTYFHHDNNVSVSLLLRARVVYTDGTEDTAEKTLPSLADTLLFHLPVGLQQMGLYDLHPEKQVWYYDVSVEDADGNYYARPYRLYADYRMYYDTFSFIYTNSLGGIDTLRIRGDYDIEIIRDFTEIQQAITGYGGETLPTEHAIINISKHEIYKGDAGWQNTKNMQDSLQDLLLSDCVYRVVAGAGNRWLRVLNLQKTQALRGSDDTKWSFPLQWRYTFDNSQYTPMHLDFGTGTNNETPGPLHGTCTAPGNLAVTALGSGVYHFSWDEVVGAEAYELAYKKPDATDWITVEAETNEKDLTFTEAGDYSWRVRTQCGPGDYSGYANGPGFTISAGSSSCSAPTNLQVVLLSMDETNASVKFTWNGVPGVLGYFVEWREFGSPTWHGIRQNHFAFGNSYTTTLKRDVQYEWRVRSACNPSGYSGYVYGANFIPSNMIGSCSPPTNLEVILSWKQVRTSVYPPSFMLYREIKFSWTNASGTSSYELQYREKNTGNWVTENEVQSPETVLLLPKDIEKTYEWRLRSNCTGGGFSNFIKGPDFDT